MQTRRSYPPEYHQFENDGQDQRSQSGVPRMPNHPRKIKALPSSMINKPSPRLVSRPSRPRRGAPPRGKCSHTPIATRHARVKTKHAAVGHVHAIHDWKHNRRKFPLKHVRVSSRSSFGTSGSHADGIGRIFRHQPLPNHGNVHRRLLLDAS